MAKTCTITDTFTRNTLGDWQREFIDQLMGDKMPTYSQLITLHSACPIAKPSTHTEIADWLDSSLQYLLRRGWGQGHYANEFGNVCAEGAVFRNGYCRTEPGKAVMHAAKRSLMDQIRRQGEMFSALTVWNDVKTRKLSQVVELFRDTIDWERKAAAEAGE